MPAYTRRTLATITVVLLIGLVTACGALFLGRFALADTEETVLATEAPASTDEDAPEVGTGADGELALEATTTDGTAGKVAPPAESEPGEETDPPAGSELAERADPPVGSKLAEETDPPAGSDPVGQPELAVESDSVSTELLAPDDAMQAGSEAAGSETAGSSGEPLDELAGESEETAALTDEQANGKAGSEADASLADAPAQGSEPADETTPPTNGTLPENDGAQDEFGEDSDTSLQAQELSGSIQLTNTAPGPLENTTYYIPTDSLNVHLVAACEGLESSEAYECVVDFVFDYETHYQFKTTEKASAGGVVSIDRIYDLNEALSQNPDAQIFVVYITFTDSKGNAYKIKPDETSQWALWAVDPSISVSTNAMNATPESPLAETKSFSLDGSLFVRDLIEVHGFFGIREYRFHTVYVFYKNGEVVGTYSPAGENIFTTLESGSASLRTFHEVRSAIGDREVDKIRVEQHFYTGGKLFYIHAEETGQELVSVSGEPLAIETVATNALDGGKTVAADVGAGILDTVTYTGLEAGATYTLQSTIVAKSSGDVVFSSSTEFIPSAPEGEVKVTLEFDASFLTPGEELVVFEIVMRDGEVVAEHADIDDPDQTVTVVAALISVFAEKVWTETNGTTATVPPAGATATLMLCADGVDYEDPVVVSAATGWSVTWTDLPKVNQETGSPVVYSVREAACSASGFELAGVSGDAASGFVVVNRKKPPSIPTTGDDTNFGLIAGLGVGGAALLVAGAAIFVHRKRNSGGK